MEKHVLVAVSVFVSVCGDQSTIVAGEIHFPLAKPAWQLKSVEPAAEDDSETEPTESEIKEGTPEADKSEKIEK